MNSSFTNKRKKEEKEFYPLKIKQKLFLLNDNNIGNINDCTTKAKNRGKKFKGNNLPFNGNNNNFNNGLSIEKRKLKKMNKSIELDISNIKKKNNNHNLITLINSKDKRDKHKNKNSSLIKKVEKTKNISNHNSMEIYNYTNKNKTIQTNKKKLNMTKNNIFFINDNYLESIIKSKKIMQKNKQFNFTQINSKKQTNEILKTVNNPKINLTKKLNKCQDKNSNKPISNDSKDNKAKFKNKILLNKLKNNKEKNAKQLVNINYQYNNNLKNDFCSDKKPAPSSMDKGYIEIFPNNISFNNNHNNADINQSIKNNKIDFLRESYKSKNETNSLNTSCIQKNNSLTQSSKYSRYIKNKYNRFDSRHLIYKTEVNLNNEKNKYILENAQNSFFRKKEANEEKEYSYISPINVHRKIFSFKKNEIIDIKNKNNYVVIIKKRYINTSRKKEFFDSSYYKQKNNIVESNKKIKEYKSDYNFDFIKKLLIMSSDKMKQMDITLKPRKNLELKIFKHIKRNSVI